MSDQRYTRGDLVWCLFGDGYSNDGWRRRLFPWCRDPDEVLEGEVLDVLDGGNLLVIQYQTWDNAPRQFRDWFDREQATKQLRPRSAGARP